MNEPVCSRTPELPEVDDPALAEKVAELTERLRRGERIDLSGDDSPHAAELRRLLPTLRLMSDLADPAARDDELGSLGDFRILREAGRGGMGIVYEAVQVPLGRRVALKVLLNAAALDPRHVQRFQVEAQAAASLQHPGIVPVFATGSERGIPFYAMQFIAGQNLAQVIEGWAKGAASTSSLVRDRMRTAAELGRQAAEALAYAHNHDVLHRDIKPSNLLVDAAGHLWITDFGLARFQSELDLTRTGDNLGTPRYMSPEQALGGRAPLDRRIDVYSLGVTLYELLTLRPAFDEEDRIKILRQIADSEPIRPRRIDPRIPVDLETIVLKAMARAPADRYSTAADLAEDLRRFLAGEPIRARRPWVGRRIRAWVRRRPALAASLVALTLMAGVLGWAEGRHRHHTTQLVSAQGIADRSRREAEAATGRLKRVEMVQQLRTASELIRADRLDRAREIIRALELQPNGFAADEFAWRYVRQELARDALTPAWPDGQKRDMTIPSPTGSILAGFNQNCPIEFLERDSGRIITTDNAPARLSPGWIGYTSFSPDGRYFAKSERGAMWIWEVSTGQLVTGFAPPPPRKLFFPILLAEGRFLTISRSTAPTEPRAGRPTLAWDLWKRETDPERPTLLANIANDRHRVRISQDGRRLAKREGHRILLMDALDGRVLRAWESVPDLPAAIPLGFTDDAAILAEVWGGTHLVFWDTATGTECGRHKLDRLVKESACFLSPDGRTIAVTENDLPGERATGAVTLWDRIRGRTHTIRPREGPGRTLVSPYFSPTGGQIALSVSHEGAPEPVTVWNVPSGARVATCPSPVPQLSDMPFLSDDRTLLLKDASQTWIWRLDHLPLAGHADEAWAVAFSREGDLLASGSDDEGGAEPHTIKLWDPRSGRLIRGWFGGDGTVSALAFAPDGKILASAHLDDLGSVRLWDVATGKLLATLEGHTKKARSVAFHPSGRWLASGASDGTARIWDVGERRCDRVLKGHENVVQEVAFSPDGKTLATAGDDETLRLWDVVRGKALRTLPAGKLLSVAYSPNGKLIATADGAGQVQLWDASTGALQVTIPAEKGVLNAVAFTRGGEAVAVAGAAGTIHLWDVNTGQELLMLGRHTAQVNGLAFSPDGSTLASCSHDGAVRLWRGGSEASP